MVSTTGKSWQNGQLCQLSSLPQTGPVVKLSLPPPQKVTFSRDIQLPWCERQLLCLESVISHPRPQKCATCSFLWPSTRGLRLIHMMQFIAAKDGAKHPPIQGRCLGIPTCTWTILIHRTLCFMRPPTPTSSGWKGPRGRHWIHWGGDSFYSSCLSLSFSLPLPLFYFFLYFSISHLQLKSVLLTLAYTRILFWAEASLIIVIIIS